MTERLDTQVLIAGGGPAGLTLACELALGGIDCTVIEGLASRPAASSGMLLPARTAQYVRARELADRLGLDSAPAWPRTHFAFLYLDTAQHSPDGVELVIPQWRTTAVLLERAVELGVRVLAGHRVSGVSQDDDTVTVQVDAGAGRLTGRYLVGCDGAHSDVAELAGFGFDVLAEPYYGLIGDFPADSCYSRFQAGSFPGGQFGVLPVNPADPSEIRLMTVENGRPGPDPNTEVTAGELAAAITRITGDPVELGTPNWLFRYGSVTRAATELQRGRILLCGDAAHAHPPAAGNGLNTAVHDALNLGWKLAAVVRGQAGQSLLGSYTDERLPVARRVCVRASAQLPVMEPARRAAPLREVLGELLEVPGVARCLIEYSTEIRYPSSDQTSDTLTGRLVPAELSRALPVPDGRGVLLRLGLGAASGPDRELVQPWSDRLRLDVLEQSRCLALPAGRYLIRPDGYIGWSQRAELSERAEPDGLRSAIRRWFGEPGGSATTSAPERAAVVPAGPVPAAQPDE